MGNRDNKDYYDPQFEMFSKSTETKTLLKVYGFTLLTVVFVVIPWGVGFITLLKWIIF